MKKFAVQRFLNHGQASSSGWVKFNVSRRKPVRDNFNISGIDATFTVADCSNKADLEFGMWNMSSTDMANMKRGLKKVAHRRAKWDRFYSAVVAYDKHIREAYNEVEADLHAAIAEQKKKDKKTAKRFKKEQKAQSK